MGVPYMGVGWLAMTTFPFPPFQPPHTNPTRHPMAESKTRGFDLGTKEIGATYSGQWQRLGDWMVFFFRFCLKKMLNSCLFCPFISLMVYLQMLKMPVQMVYLVLHPITWLGIFHENKIAIFQKGESASTNNVPFPNAFGWRLKDHLKLFGWTIMDFTDICPRLSWFLGTFSAWDFQRIYNHHGISRHPQK